MTQISRLSHPIYCHRYFKQCMLSHASFFSGFGKTTFMKYFCQHAEFITGGTTHPGSLSDCSLETNTWFPGIFWHSVLHLHSLHSHTTVAFQSQMHMYQWKLNTWTGWRIYRTTYWTVHSLRTIWYQVQMLCNDTGPEHAGLLICGHRLLQTKLCWSHYFFMAGRWRWKTDARLG